HAEPAELGERGVGVRWRRMAGLGQQVVVDVDHPSDHALQKAFSHQLVGRTREVVGERLPGERGEVCEVARDQESFPVDEGRVDHGAESRSSIRSTYSRSRVRYRRWSW